MSIKIKDTTNKYILDFNETTHGIVVREYEPSTFNQKDGEYNYSLKDTWYRSYINMFDFNSGSVTTLSTNTWTKLNTSTTSLLSNGWTHSNNRLTYQGSTGPIKLEGIASVTSGSNNEIHFSFYKNGSIIPCSEQDTTLGSGGRSSSCPFHCVATMSSGDYIEVWTKNVSSSSSITLDNVNVILTTL